MELRQKWLHSDASPIHPLRLCNEMAKFVDDETIVVGDGGDIVGLSSQVLPVNQPGQFMGPGPLGTLGVGTGFCMAANAVHPEKKILMVNGDGSFGLNGFDFDTLRPLRHAGGLRHRQRPPVGPDPRRAGEDVRRGARGRDAPGRQRALRQGRRGAGRTRRVRDGGRTTSSRPSSGRSRPASRRA